MLQYHTSRREEVRNMTRRTGYEQPQQWMVSSTKSFLTPLRPATRLLTPQTPFDSSVSGRYAVNQNVIEVKYEPSEDATVHRLIKPADCSASLECLRGTDILLPILEGLADDGPPKCHVDHLPIATHPTVIDHISDSPCKPQDQIKIKAEPYCVDSPSELPTVRKPLAKKLKLTSRRSAPPDFSSRNLTRTLPDTPLVRKSTPAIVGAGVALGCQGHENRELRLGEPSCSLAGSAKSRTPPLLDLNSVKLESPSDSHSSLVLPKHHFEHPKRALSETVPRKSTPIIVGDCGMSGCPGHSNSNPRPCEARLGLTGAADPGIVFPTALTSMKSELNPDSQSPLSVPPAIKQGNRRKVKVEETETRPDLPEGMRPLIWSAVCSSFGRWLEY